MTQAVIGLSIAYVALGILLLGLMVSTRWPVWVKFVSILLISTLYFVTYLSLGGLQGWPTSANLPDRFLLLATSIQEPDKTTGSKGVIYVWASSLAENMPATEPRAYRLDYDSEMHTMLEAAEKRTRNGIMQLGKMEWILEAESSNNLGRFSEKRKIIRIYDLPDPEMPEK
ncbi:MAG: hypothetical protein JRF07_09375 [Deltaproteobacteria bacterium]|jgi:hypothetical protein|nr:hypothetical protein [Deltaproteobacteria bacterium]MBW2476079.1 hypothetical protein [Deltaproteobacteria bacterium]MBW2519719.1 hypothetical protein [Deltaproteobacteria bacterium]